MVYRTNRIFHKTERTTLPYSRKPRTREELYREALNSLDTTSRRALDLCADGCSYKEIGNILGMDRKEVGIMMFRARRYINPDILER